MAIKNQILVVNFLAWDTANNVGKTGDSANFTLRLIKDGGAATAPTNAISEPDSTNMPGIYELELTATEMNANFVTLHGISSTSDTIIYPLFLTTERGDLDTVDSNVDSIKAVTDNNHSGIIDANITEVKDVAVTDIDDFKADVSSLLTFAQYKDIFNNSSISSSLIAGKYLITSITYGTGGNAFTVTYVYNTSTGALISATVS